MTTDDKFLLLFIGGAILYRVLRKPTTRAVWSIWTGPKFHASLIEVITKNDPNDIKRLHDNYMTWPVDVQEQFKTTVRKLGLKQPW